MKRFLLFSLSIALQFSAVVGHTQNTFHGTQEVAQANLEVNGVETDLFLFRGPSGPSGSQTFLDYGSFIENPDGSFTFTDGHGVIPNDAFTANTLQHFSLNVDTSQVSGFKATSCTVSFSPTFHETCVDGTPLGIIQIDWQLNGGSSTHEIQHLTSSSGPFTRKFDIDEDDSTADATGTFMGSSFTDLGRARIGKARDSTVSITRGH
jgi:hypothetical protein